MTLNKYQKANEFIRLSEEQKESIVANILKEDTAPARKPFFLKPWMAVLGTAFAVMVLYFGVFHRMSAPMAAPAPMSAPALQEASSGTPEDSAPAAEEKVETGRESPAESEVNSFMATQDSVSLADEEAGGPRIITGKEAEEIDLTAYGEKRETVILDTAVSVYGNRAAKFVRNGETVAMISEEELSEEELNGLITGTIRNFSN